jgi:hypothetical protein
VPSVHFRAQSFTGKNVSVNGARTETFSWAQLVWAAITVGKAETSHLSTFGISSVFELIYRIAILFANLQEDSTGRLEKSDAFSALDPSEKGAMSYFFGLTTAKLLAEAHLGVSWLMHLDVYRKALQPLTTSGGKAKPDLVGKDGLGDWVVIEAKGRSGTMPTAVMVKAKAQTAKLSAIAGKTVTLRVAHGSYFSRDKLAVHWMDPPRRGRSATLRISPEEFDAHYYAPILSLVADPRRVRAGRRIGAHLYRFAAVPEVDVQVGIRLDLISTPADGGIAITVERTGPSREIASTYVGGDGVAVALGPSWAEDRMRLPPAERPLIGERRI